MKTRGIRHIFESYLGLHVSHFLTKGIQLGLHWNSAGQVFQEEVDGVRGSFDLFVETHEDSGQGIHDSRRVQVSAELIPFGLGLRMKYRN
jgi:hypothetical protein